jgi:hypothetical protein
MRLTSKQAHAVRREHNWKDPEPPIKYKTAMKEATIMYQNEQDALAKKL